MLIIKIKISIQCHYPLLSIFFMQGCDDKSVKRHWLYIQPSYCLGFNLFHQSLLARDGLFFTLEG